MCVCIFFYGCFFYDKIEKTKKNLMFWFAHGKGL
jgi:hypothetical protein